jgi:hypothetical protein
MRTQQLELNFGREIAEVAERAEFAAEVASAAEASAERGESDGKASAMRLEGRLEQWLEARREQRRGAREELRREVNEAAEDAVATASAVASAAAIRAANGLRAVGARAEEEARSAENIAQRAEGNLRQLRSEETELARQLRAEDAEVAGRVRATVGAVGQLRQEVRTVSERSYGLAQRSEAALDGLMVAQRGEVALDSFKATVGDLCEEVRLERRRGKETAEHVIATKSELHAALNSEVAAAMSRLRGELQDHIGRSEGKLWQAQGQHVKDMREHLTGIADQVVFLEDRLSPDALASSVRRDVEEAARDAVFDEMRDLRVGWCQKADYKFDCAMQCLHVLYLKVGLSPTGALSSLQRAVREAPTAASETPLSPGGPGGAVMAATMPRPGSPPARNVAVNAGGPLGAGGTEPRGPPGLGTPGRLRGRSPTAQSPQAPSLGHARRLGDYSMIE